MTDTVIRHGAWTVWRWPLAIALSSAIGLVSALVGDGGWDALSWLALAPPLGVSWAAWIASRRGEQR